MGVTYDPEELCQRYEAGEPLADLLRIPPLPRGKDPMGHAGEALLVYAGRAVVGEQQHAACRT